MDPPPNQQATEVNLTRALEALSPYLNHPRQTVVRIEAFVLAAVGLMFLQLLLGPVRRRSSHWSVQGVLWLAYTASFPLITYTLGQMVSSPIKNALYPLWAVFLFWAAGCTHSIIAYDLEDNKSWKRHLFELMQYFVYITIILTLLYPSSNRTPFKLVKNQHPQPIVIVMVLLLTMLVYANVVRLIAGWMVTNSAPSKFVADYMREQVDAIKGNQQESSNPDPVTMKGYKYLVWPSRKEKGLPSSDLITIEKIWEMKIDGSLLNSNKGDSSKNSNKGDSSKNSNKGGLGVQDLCLSFALSHLLKRRYFEMECAEANLPETRNFVLKGLLSEEEEANGYKRAFQIIEVELSFLYDFFFTKYATLFHMEVSYLIISVIKLIFIASCVVVLLMSSPTVKLLDPVIEVGTRKVDVIITIVIMASFLAVEVVQFVLYATSDWATVSLACSCIRHSNSKWILPLIRFPRRFKVILRRFKVILRRFKVILRRFKVIELHGYWQNKMGQSSVISGSIHNPLLFSKKMHNLILPIRSSNPFAGSSGDLLVDAISRFMSCLIWLFASMIFSGKTFIEVPDLVKREIVSCLKKYKDYDPLTNGRRALCDRGLLKKFSWTLENRSQTSIMLVWHIATEYCCVLWTKEKELDKRQVATTLSRYCAYLISSASNLLPGNSTDTLFTFEGVLSQGRTLLHEIEPDEDLLQAVIDLERRSNATTTINDGIFVHDSRGNDTTTKNDDIFVHDSRGNDTTTKNDNIFVQGLKLVRQLEKEIEDEDDRWRMLAEFWVDTIIYIAPSDNAKAHMERLAQGGEFLTHVWALLTHVGILQHGKETDSPV